MLSRRKKGKQMKPEIIYLPLSEIKPYENNPRYNESAVDAVAQSIKEFGFKNPIILDKHKVIIAGHTRYKASQQLGLEEVPCIIASDLTEEQVKAYRLVDNKVGELAEWDFLKLEKEITGLPEYDFEGFGFDLQEIEDKLGIEKEITDDAYEIPETIETKVKKGEVWQLGNHRLLCGDSTKEEDVDKLMNGNKADMVFTDPPYLMGFTGNVHADGSKSFNSKHGAIKNDKMSREDGDNFILDFFENIKKFCVGSFYVCFYRLGLDYIFRALDTLNNQYKALIIWDKGNHTLSNSDYMSRYEPIVYGWFNEHRFYGDRSNFDIWDIQRTQKNDLHPTMKPIALCEKAINNSSVKNDNVLDLFGGSGSTLIACEQLNRKCYMMELDEKYASVIVDRWEKFTGQVAKKIC